MSHPLSIMFPFGRKGPNLSTHDPLDPAAGPAPEPVTTDAAAAVHRRLSRALADLGIMPQPIGPRVQPWTSLVDGVITFGALSPTTAARLANVLEDLASARPFAVAGRPECEEAVASSDFGQPFEPVASPYEAGSTPSRFHPRLAS